MRKNIRLIISAIIVLLGVFWYAHIGKMNNIYNVDVDTSDYKTTAIYVNETISQRFVCPENHLDGLKLKCKLSGNVDQINVNLTLKDVETGDVLAEQTITGESLEESKFYLFEFDRVEECNGKEFVLNVSEENDSTTDYIDFCYTDGQEKGTSLLLNGEEQEGTLVMRTVTNRFDFETFCVLLVFIIYVVVFMKFLYRLFK